MAFILHQVLHCLFLVLLFLQFSLSEHSLCSVLCNRVQFSLTTLKAAGEEMTPRTTGDTVQLGTIIISTCWTVRRTFADRPSVLTGGWTVLQIAQYCIL